MFPRILSNTLVVLICVNSPICLSAILFTNQNPELSISKLRLEFRRMYIVHKTLLLLNTSKASYEIMKVSSKFSMFEIFKY
jgi:hypothetical protein